MGLGDALAGAGSGAATGSVLGPFGTLIGAGIGLFGSLFGAHEQADASAEAARIQAEAQQQIAAQNAAAQKYIADLQAKASADALAFSRGGAENAFQNNEVSRAGNYDQWAAAQNRIGSVAKLLGFGDRAIPAYRPGVDPHFDGSGGGSSTPSGPAPSISAGGGDIGSQISAYFKSRGVPDSETPYWVQKWAEFGANDPNYFNQRLAGADIFRSASPSAPPSAPPSATPPSIAALLSAHPTMPQLSSPSSPLNYNLAQYLS